jgi:dihydrofolate synthase/folylpolyglutamate synthase
VLDDKDAAGIVGALAPAANRFYVTSSQSDRAVAPEDLVETVRSFSDETTDFDSFAEAMELARDWAAENERRAVVVTGSISLVGEALALAQLEGWKP